MAAPETIAFFLYDDHDAGQFISFQKSYLNNVWTRFLFDQNIIRSFDKWYVNGRIGTHYSLNQDCTSGSEDDDIDEEYVSSFTKCTASTAKELKQIKQEYAVYDIPVPQHPHSKSYTALDMYRTSVEEALVTCCQEAGDILTDGTYTTSNYCIMIHDGGIFIKGNLGDKTAIFCFANSKHEFANLIKTCLKNKEKRPNWYADRVGVLEIEIYGVLEEKKLKKKAKYEVTEDFKIQASTGVWFTTRNQLEWFIGDVGEDVSKNFYNVLIKLSL